MLASAALASGPAWAQEAKPCRGDEIGTAQVSAVIDGRTLRLADGGVLRLAGIEIAQAPAAHAVLAALVAGRSVRLQRLGPATDRHGRILSLVFPDVVPIGSPSGRPLSIQRALLEQGHARVAAQVGDGACAAEWHRAEAAARIAGLGLWADPHYVIRKAEDAGDILAERGRFTVVEGQVVSVRESGGTIYVNFGRRWSEDFTVTVRKRLERTFAAAGMELKKLGSRHVRVRGVVEERGGPWIEANRPEQIEIAD